MPRRKTAMRLIENARSRAASYAKRTKGLQKKASELATLCGVPVALVCAPAAGAAGPRLVFESEEGVLDRYRAAALPPETRARHTHRGYLEAELGKERAKLARLRPAALPDWDPALNDMTLDQARGVLETIDAALRATTDRMAALGLPTDGRLELEQVAAPDDVDAFAPQQLGLDVMDMGTGFQLQMMPYHGDDGLREQFLMQPEYGLQCVGGSYDVGAVEQTQAPGGYGDNAGCGWPDLSMCYTADGSWDAVTPVGYYPEPDFTDGALAPGHYSAQDVTGGYYLEPDFTDGALAPGHYSAQDVTGGDYANTLPLEYPMGMDESFAYPDMGSSYAAHWQAQEFQRSDTDARNGHYQCSDPGTYSSGQVFNYSY